MEVNYSQSIQCPSVPRSSIYYYEWLTFTRIQYLPEELLTLLEGMKREENLRTHILTDSLDAPIREPLGEIPKAEACCEEKDGIELLDRRLPVESKEIVTLSMTCIMARDYPKRLK
jgi:hypothetical protein